MKVIVGSKNPVKFNVTKDVFESVFSSEEIEFLPCSAASGVPDQPYGIEETKTGALNRALDCQKQFPDADYFVGLEGGIEIIDDEYWVTAWMCVLDKNGKQGFGRTSSFMLPEKITQLLKDGMELGHATDVVFDDDNSKHKGGVIAFLTDEGVTRTDFYMDALRFALIPFVKSEFY